VCLSAPHYVTNDPSSHARLVYEGLSPRPLLGGAPLLEMSRECMAFVQSWESNILFHSHPRLQMARSNIRREFMF